MRVEITDLVVPVKDLGDKEEDVKFFSQWIYKNLGDEVPLHFRKFLQDYLMMDVEPTPVEMNDKSQIRERIMSIDPEKRKELKINKSTLWYQQKRIKEGKSIKIYNKTKVKIG